MWGAACTVLGFVRSLQTIATAAIECPWFLQVQHNSVELAMEWLFNHPEEEVVAGQQPAADTEAAAPEADIGGSFPTIVDEDLASSSKPPVSIPRLLRYRRDLSVDKRSMNT
jgi:hypothetical protein